MTTASCMDRRTFLASTAALGVVSLGSVQAAAYEFTPSMADRYVPGAAKWLMANFGDVLRARAHGTRYDVALLCAIACQESGYAWWRTSFRGNRTAEDVLQMLVLDDGPNRSAAKHQTEAGMRATPAYSALLPSLVVAADATRDAQGVTARKGHLRYGYGLFQYDLDNIRHDPGFWTTTAASGNGQPFVASLGQWRSVDACADRLIRVLNRKMEAAGGDLGLAIRYYNGSNAASIKYSVTVRRFAEIIRSTALAGKRS